MLCGLESLWAWFSSDAFHAVPFRQWSDPPALSTVDEKRGTELTRPIVLMQPFLVLRLGCDRRLLDWLAFVSIGFEEVQATWSATMPAMYQKENIAISASISVQIIMKPCSRSPNYGTTRCRVSEISVVLYMKPTEPVVVQRSCLNQAYPKYRLNNRSMTVSMWIPVNSSNQNNCRGLRVWLWTTRGGNLKE